MVSDVPYTRTKTSQPPTRLQIYIDRLRFVLGVVAVIAIAITFTLNQIQTNDINHRITKIESPCLRYGPESRECHESFQAAIESITDYQLCLLLSQRPDLTGVAPAKCRQIAREARRHLKTLRHTKNQRSTAQPASHSLSGSAGSGGTHGEGHHPSQPPSPHAPSPSPQPSSPQPTPSPSPGKSGGAGPPSSPSSSPPSESTPSKPPAVVVEAPGLPAQACVPGVLSVNC